LRFSMKIANWKVAAVAVVLTGTQVQGQDPGRPTVPQIVTSAQGEVRIAPDRATITMGVQTRAATAVEASAQNARKQRAIIDAIKAKGVPAEQISTSQFNVMPETRYDREGQAAPRTTSYLVSNMVTVELKRVDLVGAVIDAALTAGANQINSLAFGIANPDSARRAALAIAVARSRADADVIARAAGGSLGPLIEIMASDYQMPHPVGIMAMRAEAAQATPVEAGQETVRASVNARWQFLSGAR
jgi:uncharacterized protein